MVPIRKVGPYVFWVLFLHANLHDAYSLYSIYAIRIWGNVGNFDSTNHIQTRSIKVAHCDRLLDLLLTAYAASFVHSTRHRSTQGPTTSPQLGRTLFGLARPSLLGLELHFKPQLP
ncbi:hypothetical protein C8Q79DRAFT_161733 [Trametes meyenii]|nr:hypothetical protein C8Q79DRAFT_161733 [Trametes meyenii]